MIRNLTRLILVALGRFVGFVIFKLTITGKENLPASGPLLVVSNHFSWFEAPTIMTHLPYAVTFVAATELQRSWFFRLLFYAFEMIPVWRGQPDRKALAKVQKMLENGRVVGIFPEGGIDPSLRDRVASGQVINEVAGHMSRESAQLISARPGTAFVAIRTDAELLPIAMIGTEKVIDNLRRLRRTPVEMRIGPTFGPLKLDKSLKGNKRRAALDELGHDMMRELAKLFPPENRGPYT